MSALGVRGLTVEREGFRLGPVDLDVGEGEAVAVIGPSGAGKTTLLRAVAGFAALRSGTVHVGPDPVTDRPPEERRMGYVPQGLALFPHRTVRGNVGYPLEVRGSPDADARTDHLLAEWGLAGLARASVLRVSGGEQQRTAMARALAAGPEVLLWDEPLSAVDASARAVLIESIRTVLRTQRVALLLVTHDAETAFSVADRLVLLEEGTPVAVRSPRDLVERPPTRFAAEFLGYDNVLARADLAGAGSSPLATWLLERSGPQGVAFLAGDLDPGDPDPRWSGRVVRRRAMPTGTQLWVDAGGLELSLLDRDPASAGTGARPGETVHFGLAVGSVRPLGLPSGSAGGAA